MKQEAKPWYSDQVLPFDITLAGTNEMGAATAMKIFGVEILNEGGGISIDDAVTEMQATFVARFVEPWQAVTSKFGDQHQVLRGGKKNPSRAGEDRAAGLPVVSSAVNHRAPSRVGSGIGSYMKRTTPLATLARGFIGLLRSPVRQDGASPKCPQKSGISSMRKFEWALSLQGPAGGSLGRRTDLAS